MKAAYIESPCPPEGIRYGDFPDPVPRPHEVLVRVAAAAVNHVDTFVRSGRLDVGMPLPFVIGRDMAGVVEAAGTQTGDFKRGDAVWSNCLGIGGLQGPSAEYAAVPSARLFRLPSGTEPVQAAASVHSALTASIGLIDKAALRTGEALFINGGSGSVGTAVLQIAKAAGALVIATAGSPESAAWCRENGADLVIDYRDRDIPSKVRAFTPGGVNIYWDGSGRLDLNETLSMLAPRGRIVVIAGSNVSTPLPVGPFYLRETSLFGFTVTGTPASELGAHAARINDWFKKGILKTRIQEILPLAEAARAHELEEKGGLKGKIVLVP